MNCGDASLVRGLRYALLRSDPVRRAGSITQQQQDPRASPAITVTLQK